MFEKTPTTLKMIGIATILLAGPVTVFSFLFGGAYVGAIALVIVCIVLIVLYMIAVRAES